MQKDRFLALKSAEAGNKPQPPQPPARRSKRTKTQYVSSAPIQKRRRSESFIGRCSHCKKCNDAKTLTSCNGNCSTRIHVECLKAISTNFGNDEEVSWQCISCQRCTICKKSAFSEEPLLKCFKCYLSFHQKCHGTEKIEIVKENRFHCNSCKKSNELSNLQTLRNIRKVNVSFIKEARVISEADNSSSDEDFLGFGTPEPFPLSHLRARSQTVTFQHQINREKEQSSSNNCSNTNDDDGTDIPDATKWTVNEVYEYFKEKFPRHAHIFEEEEIDGRVLYKLSRDDVMRFKMKTGPSITIYDHIVEIQKKKARSSVIITLSR